VQKLINKKWIGHNNKNVEVCQPLAEPFGVGKKYLLNGKNSSMSRKDRLNLRSMMAKSKPR